MFRKPFTPLGKTELPGKDSLTLRRWMAGDGEDAHPSAPSAFFSLIAQIGGEEAKALCIDTAVPDGKGKCRLEVQTVEVPPCRVVPGEGHLQAATLVIVDGAPMFCVPGDAVEAPAAAAAGKKGPKQAAPASRAPKQLPPQDKRWVPTVFLLLRAVAALHTARLRATATSAAAAATPLTDTAPLVAQLPPYAGVPLPCLAVMEPASEMILRGANLMAKGVVALQPAKAPAGSVYCASVLGNPVPFATGFVTDVVEEGLPSQTATGAALAVVHSLGDFLWQAFAPAVLAAQGPVFIQRTPPPAVLAALAVRGAVAGIDDDDDDQPKKKSKPIPKAARKAKKDASEEAAAAAPSAQPLQEVMALGGTGFVGPLPPGLSELSIVRALPRPESPAATGESATDDGSATPVDDDEGAEEDATAWPAEDRAHFALFEAASRLAKVGLPVAVNEFIAGLFLECLPDAGPGTERTSFDFHATQWKKPLAFLRTVAAPVAEAAPRPGKKGAKKGPVTEETAEGAKPMLTLVEAAPGAWQITAVDKQAPRYRRHRREFHSTGRAQRITFARARLEALQADGAALRGDEDDIDAFLGLGTPRITCVQTLLYCPGRSAPAFEALVLGGKAVAGSAADLGAAPTIDEMLEGSAEPVAAEAAEAETGLELPEAVTAEQAFRNVKNYCVEQGLVVRGPDAAALECKPGDIKLDPLLAKLWHGGQSPVTAPVKVVADRAVSRLVPRTVVSRQGAPALKNNGHPPHVTLTAERRRNHFVTVVSGLEAYGAHLKGLQAAWRPLLGLAIDMEEVVATKAAKATVHIVLHGDIRERLAGLLTTLMGLPTDVVVLAGKGPKGK